ncbi:mannosyl-oligosaccharide alpha-1,2-mannosidase [Geosmithia morbida]|uniref:alpha-1,2-Mannosidase n=1 Tax=Geosmithia morbida TaxID=1094350 RepID=A0A9P4YX68_9HYPO|nr:mannosyl-oligosaccharide alpha-1,2-mannosidase [Geosmithia morbida]KAF4123429.1 mannosyl-oligosaccharide alpha-1,2-mannosidase [Geosmithia morbida]
MIRDPFDIHRNNILRTTASRAVQNIREAATVAAQQATQAATQAANQATQAGADALDNMSSFSVPRNLPNFSGEGRDLEDSAWSALRGAGAKVQDRVTGMFDQESLPMYKDKPYSHVPSRRNRSWWRKKRILGSLVFTFVSVLYLFGFFSEESSEGRLRGSSGKPSWSSWAALSSSADWDDRRQRVVEAFEVSWDAYERYAFGNDEFHPVTRTGRNMAPRGMGWIIIDSLDTMMLMNQTTRLRSAREWISTKLTWDQDQDVSTFETTIRMLGGLLTAHYLSNEFPDMAPLTDDDPGAPGEDLYLEKGKDLADRLLGAFDSPSGIPYSSINLADGKGILSHADGGAASTAEATSVQLEFKYLAKLTGEKAFWDAAVKVMEVVDGQNAADGLVPIFIHPDSGEFRGRNIRLGSRGDSYYEYLIKQYLQTNKAEPVYQDMWRESMDGIRKHLVTYTRGAELAIVGERPDGLAGELSPKMDHLVCFLPGTIALAATGGLTEAEARKLPTWSEKDEADMQLARELTQTCWGMYKYMATGLAPEIAYFDVADPPPSPASSQRRRPPSDSIFDDQTPEAPWRSDYRVKPNDVHNLQRPETAESLFYMWRITGDVKYREWGWEMFKSFIQYTAVGENGGFTSLSDANVIPPKVKDNMESFWLAETLKYLYLLFSPDDLLPLDKVVLNTEAHVFPRFDMGQLFSTGWQRKPRDSDGNIIEAEKTMTTTTTTTTTTTGEN